MIVNEDELQPYLDSNADLIPLNKWDKTTTRIVKGEPKIQKRGKTPLLRDWTATGKDIELTLEKAKSGYNVGYRLGDDDLIIDIDHRNFKTVNGKTEDSLVKLCEFLNVKDLANKCPVVITGSGGFHFYLKKPVGVSIRETIDDFPGIEFKTKGRQVVAAGSKHPNGKYYHWGDFTVSLCDKPNAPKKLIKLLEYDPLEQNMQGDEGGISNDQLEELLDNLPVYDFNTNDNWFGIMCASHHGTGGEGIEEFLTWSLSDPDFKDDESLIRQRWESLGGKKLSVTVATLYKAVLAYGGDINAIISVNDFEGLGDSSEPDLDDILSTPELETSSHTGLAIKLATELSNESSEVAIVKAIRASLQSGTIEQIKAFKIIKDTLGMTKSELKEISKQIKEQIVDDLGRVLAEKTLQMNFYNGQGLVLNNNGQFWAYNGKFWDVISRQYVGRHITIVLDKIRNKTEINVKENTIVSEALSILERITAVRKDVLRLREKPYPVVNCQNGELWIKSCGGVILKKHEPKSYLLQVLNVEYSADSICPLFDESIRQTFRDFKDCEDIVRHFEEFMGYVLHPDKQSAHWWLLKGPGGDGKTTLMKILAGLLGDAIMPESIVRLKKGFLGEGHAVAELVGKLLLYDDDLNHNAILPDSALKKLSENGELTANPKGYPGFKFAKVCAVAMLSNGFPATKDVTRGFRRRAMVFPFNRGFHEDGAILNLDERIIKEEIAGVLNKALAGLQRLRKRKGFKEPMSCRLAREEWLHESNPVAFFISERVEITESLTDTVILNDMYNEYTDWAIGHNIKTVGTKQSFRSTMEDMDIMFGKIGGNKNVFKKVKIEVEPITDFNGEDD